MGYCSWGRSKSEINLVQYSTLSVSLRVGAVSLSNWGLISVESASWMSVWAARIGSTAVSGLEHNSTKHIWCELLTWLLSSFPLIHKPATVATKTPILNSMGIKQKNMSDRDLLSIFKATCNKHTFKSWNCFLKISQSSARLELCFSFPVFY